MGLGYMGAEPKLLFPNLGESYIGTRTAIGPPLETPAT